MSDVGNNTLDNNELWQAFYTEVSEQLDNLELILADNHAESSADIHQLFRDFHTIKSSCAMMDFHSMEKIAHASEDYLDLVRKGRTSLTQTAIHHLLGGIDWLKSQLQNAKNTGNLPENNAELVATLQALSAAHVDNVAAQPIENSTHEDAATESFVQTLSEDEVNEFASACQQELLIGLSPGVEPAKIKRSLNKLVSICNLVGFTGISSLLKKYIRATNPLSANRAAAIAAEIIERIISVEKNYGVDCGSESLRTVFLDTMFVDFAQLSGRLDYLLDLIENNPDDTQSIEQCEDLLLILCVNVSLFGYRDLLNFFRYVLQTIRSIRRGDIPDKRAAFYAVRNAVDFPIAETVQDGETTSVKTELQTRLSDLNYSISKAIYASGTEGFIDSVLGLVDIQRETLEILMPESLSYLHSATAERKNLYEIDIDIDCEPSLMDHLVNWISSNGHIVHNRSVFDDHSREDARFYNYICFIAAFDKTPAIDGDLRRIDATMQSLRYRTIHYHEALQKPALDKTAEPAGKHSTATPNAADQQASATLRIESHTLDNLVTQTGEMIMAHNMLQHEIASKTFEEAISLCKTLLEDDTSSEDNALIGQDCLEALNTAVNTIFTAQQKIIDKNQKVQQSVSSIQSRILDLRVIPISSVFNRIPQLVKKMAESQGKKIQLVIEGKEVRIDKGMVDILMEPLIHLVRNCIDHGIEQPGDRLATGKAEEATLVLAASQEGSTLILEISDNGRGINLEKIQESAIRKGFIQASDKLSDQEICKLIFLPGFSTADVITETSGRGVGMDVVITRINHIGGDIDVHTTPGHGTRFTMTLPLSAAIQSIVMVTANHHRYAIPHSSVMEIISLPTDAVCSVLGQPTFILRNAAIPLFHLHDLALQNLETGAGDALDTHQDVVVLVMAQGAQRIGVIVDKVHGREDVFVRELHKNLRSLPSICGATALGNGELAFILNSGFLLSSATQKTSAWLNPSQTTH